MRHNCRAMITAKTPTMPGRTAFSIKAPASVGKIVSVLRVLVMVLSDFCIVVFSSHDSSPVDSFQGKVPLFIYRSNV